ncbi:MAG TPA: FHA domain-containing protein [Kineosporiaceae bacterium]
MTRDSLQNVRIRVVPGPGLVAVLGDVLLVVPSVDPGQEPALEALLAAAESASLERAVARVVADFTEDQVPPFCLVAPGEVTGLFALVHGEVELSAEGTEGGARLRGREARTWVDRALPSGLQRLVVTTGCPADLEPDPYVDLRSGVVRGSAVLVTRRDEPAATPHAVEAVPESVGRPQADTPDGDTPNVEDAAPTAQPSATWPIGGGEERRGAGGFRPEQIRFGQGGRIEPLEPSGARPVNGHDGNGRPTAHPSADDPDAGALAGPPPTHTGAAPTGAAPTGAGDAPSSPPPAESGEVGEGTDVGPAAVDPASPADAPPPAAGAAPSAEAVPAARVAGPSGEGPAYLDITTTLSRAPREAPRAPERGAAARLEGEAARAEESEQPVVGTLLDLPAVEAPIEPDRSGPARVAAPASTEPPDASAEADAFYARTQVLPPPLPSRNARAVPPPAVVDPFGMPAPVAPLGSPAQVAPVAPFAGVAPVAPFAGVAPVAPVAPVSPLAAAPVGAPAAPRPRGDLLGEPAHPPAGHGRLVIENGPDVLVDRECVIGRNPEVDPDVAHGRARAVTLPDAEQRISRVHARLLITETGVEIVDAGSVNGTWIEPPGSVGWIAMVPRVPAPLPLGSKIQVGDLVLTFEPAVPA